MTLPILPFASAAMEPLGLPGAPEPAAQGLPFASLLGSALGAGAAGPALPQLRSFVAQLIGSAQGRSALGESGIESGTTDPLAQGDASSQIDALSREQVAFLFDALSDEGGKGSRRHPGDSSPTLTFPNGGALGLTGLRAALREQIPADSRQALLNALQSHFPAAFERWRAHQDGDDAAPIAAPELSLIAPSQPGTDSSISAAAAGLAALTAERRGADAGDVPGALRLVGADDVSSLPRGLRLAAGTVDALAIRRDMAALRPEFRDRLEQLIARMQNEFGYTVEVVETVRTQARQDALFAQGRTAPGPVVTWTRSSPHQEGRAADVMIDGSYDNADAFARMARLAREVGLRTLWPRDPGHVELSATTMPAASVASAPPAAASEPRGPQANAARAGIQRPVAASPIIGAVTPPGVTGPVPTPPRAAPLQFDRANVERQAAPPGATVPPAPQLPAVAPAARHQPARVAQVAAVAAVATVAAPARVAQVAAVGTPGRVDASARTTPSTRQTPSASVVASARVAPVVDAQSNVSAAETRPAATNAPDLSGVVDRVIAAVTAHLERDNGRGASRDDRTAERDLVAAVRERVEAGGLHDASRAAESLLTRTGAPDRAKAPAPMSNIDRVARTLELRDAAAERPLSSVLLRLDHPEGGEDRIRIDLRGHTVSTVMDVRDAAAAERLAEHAPELARALEQRGLDPESVTIRTVRPVDAAFTGAAASATERDAIRSTGGSSSSSSTFSGEDRAPRDPNRAFDHQNGDGRSRGRRDSKGSR